MRGPFSSGLPHPSLICGLCRQVGVRWSDDETTQMPLQTLDTRMIVRYSVWPGGKPYPRGIGFRFPPASEDEAEAKDTSDGDEFQGDETMGEQGTEAIPQPDATSSLQIQNLQRQMDGYNKDAQRQIQRLAARQDHMFGAMNMSFASLKATLQIFNPNAQFPYQQPAPMPRFPPSDSDEEQQPPLPPA